MGNRELTDEALRDEMFAMFGTRRTTSLLGWCLLFSLAGVSGERAMRDAQVGGLTSRYRAVADLQRLAEALRAKGYRLDPEAPARTSSIVMTVGAGA